jgi:2-aminophenol/2-amino-5-chlorophenol 1,6-dioxygenase subunit alpha
MTIQKAYIVPGQPHIYLAPHLNRGWASLKEHYERIGQEIASSGAELMLLYSTQWFSVIGHLFQTDPNPRWTLVDQNWYEYGEIPYDFRIDPSFGELYCDLARKAGMQAATVNYHGFPVDPGTVVALKLLNPGNAIPASVVSCNIYAEREETRALGRIGRAAIDAAGKKTIVVAVTNFSNRYHTHEIDPANDSVSSSKDDEWNRKILEILQEGRLQDVTEVTRDFAREANADMNFKAIWWLAALMGETNEYDGRVWDYQPVWGTGAALVELTPVPGKKQPFEKEYDEVQSFDAPLEAGTGLDSHNVLEDATQPSPGATAESEMTSASSVQPAVSPKSATPSLPQVVRTDKAPRPVGPYPHARRSGEMLYLSGIGPRRPGSGEIPGVVFDEAGNIVDHDIEVQTRSVIENIRTILEEGGSSLDRVVDVTVFLTDMKRDFERFNQVYAEYFGTIQPTRTTVGVDSLPTPIAVELKVIALA